MLVFPSNMESIGCVSAVGTGKPGEGDISLSTVHLVLQVNK